MKMIHRRRLLATMLAAVVATATAFQTSAPLLSSTPTRQSTNLFSSVPERTSESPQKPPLSTLVKRVAVAGATGRTGKLVVQQLLSQNVPVLALVRDTDKAKNTLDPTNELLTIRQTDLGSKDDVIAAVKNEGECDAAIWCATGFSDAP